MSFSQNSSSTNDPWSGIPHVVVLLNFGGPATEAEVEPFLHRLFLDPFIIRAPLGKTLRAWLARRIAKKRAPKAIEEYKAIGFSPINRMTASQARSLEKLLQERRPGTKVMVANRYTAPFASEVVKTIDPKGCRLFLVTLYPHLCHSTTVSSLRDFDLAFEAHHGHRDMPSTRIFSWWQSPRFLDFSAARLQAALMPMLSGDEPITVIFSAHGIPIRYHLRGDPYVTETQAHAADMQRRTEVWLAAQGMAPGRCHWQLSFQSRVGPVEWVGPYTADVIKHLGKERGGKVLLVPISFTSDHIETLFEMDHTYRELALASGFFDYKRAIPANDDPELAACLAEVLVSRGF